MKLILQTILLALSCTSVLVLPSVSITTALDEPLDIFTSLKDNSENDFEDSDCSKYHYDLADESAQLSPFASSFTRSVTSSNVLKELFDIHLSKEEAGRIHYDIIWYIATELGAQDPDSLAQSIAKAAEVALPNITPSSLTRVYSNTIERFLRDQEVLTPENALSLGDTYAQFLAASVPNDKDGSDRSKVFTQLEGSRDFLISTGVIKPEILPFLASIYVDELLSARRRQCLIQDASRLSLYDSAASLSSSSSAQIQNGKKNSYEPQMTPLKSDNTVLHDSGSSSSSSAFHVQNGNKNSYKPQMNLSVSDNAKFYDSGSTSSSIASQIQNRNKNSYESQMTRSASDNTELYDSGSSSSSSVLQIQDRNKNSYKTQKTPSESVNTDFYDSGSSSSSSAFQIQNRNKNSYKPQMAPSVSGNTEFYDSESSSSSSASQIQNRNENSYKPEMTLWASNNTESYDSGSSLSSSSSQAQSENEKLALEAEMFKSVDSTRSSPYSSSEIGSKKENSAFQSQKNQAAFDLPKESCEDSKDCHDWKPSYKSPFITSLIKFQGKKGILKKVFTAAKRAKATVFQRIFIEIISQIVPEIGISNPGAIFQAFLKIIKRAFKFLTSSSFVNAFFKSIERLLKKKRILKLKNANKLAKMFYECIEEFFLPIFDLKLQELDLLLYAVAKGTKKFLNLLGLYKYDELRLFAKYFIQELFNRKNS